MTTDPASPPAGQEVMMIDVEWRQPFIDYIREWTDETHRKLSSSFRTYLETSTAVGVEAATQPPLL
jgi:hypothetical protein